MRPELILKDLDDPVIRENFKRLLAFFDKDTLLNLRPKFFEITFTAGGTNIKYKHNLGFVPKDIIVTSISAGESVVFNYDDFDDVNFDLSPSGACTVRFFAGYYREGN